MKPSSRKFDQALLRAHFAHREKRKDAIAWRRIKKLKKETSHA